jgi:hypothetical protein
MFDSMIRGNLLFLFAACTAAQLTTSFWLPKLKPGMEKVRFVASVVDADRDRLTLAVSPDNDTDYETLGITPGSSDTYTFASTLFEFYASDIPGATRKPSGDFAYSYKCEMQTADTEAVCTASSGPGFQRLGCNPPTDEAFSDTDTASVETNVKTRPISTTTPFKLKCGTISEAPVPSSVPVGVPVPRTAFETHEFIITAGEDKVAAAAGGAASTSSAGPTGSQTSNGTGTTASPTGAAASMKTIAPALAGLGAAVAMFL